MSGAFFSKRNLLFDLDGTLVNSTPAHARAFIDTLKDLHHELAKKFNYSDYAGRPTREVFKAIGFVQDVQLDEMTERKQQFYREAVDLGEVEVFPAPWTCWHNFAKPIACSISSRARAKIPPSAFLTSAASTFISRESPPLKTHPSASPRLIPTSTRLRVTN